MTDQDRKNLIRQYSFTRQVLNKTRDAYIVTQYEYDPDTDTHIKRRPVVQPINTQPNSDIK